MPPRARVQNERAKSTQLKDKENKKQRQSTVRSYRPTKKGSWANANERYMKNEQVKERERERERGHTPTYTHIHTENQWYRARSRWTAAAGETAKKKAKDEEDEEEETKRSGRARWFREAMVCHGHFGVAAGYITRSLLGYYTGAAVIADVKVAAVASRLICVRRCGTFVRSFVPSSIPAPVCSRFAVNVFSVGILALYILL